MKTDKEILRVFYKIMNGLLEKKSRNISNIFKFFLKFIFCIMTDRPTVKVNEILDAQLNLNLILILMSLNIMKIGPKTPMIWGNV